MSLRFVIAFTCVAFGPVAALGNETPPEPASYRTQEYRSATPATLNGARVLTTDEAHEIWRNGAAVFIDVLPQAPRPANLAPEVVWRDKPRFDIPGSLWLPDTGYGALAPNMESFFRAGLRKATGDNPSRTIIFYCLRNCWMSWNAAKRAMVFGYLSVDWYPDGTDGWSEAGFLLEIRGPEPRP
jgi:PQQ-dependent catabolism-associated CXXCW motif protein